MTSTATPTGTSSSSAASATSSVCGTTLYNIPVQDASCGMPYGGNHTTLMSNCCGSADVVSYADNCGLYCLAEGQSVDDLTACLYDSGAAWSDVFCRGNRTATATATGADATLASGASVIASASGGGETGGSETSGSSSSTGSSSAAAGRASAGLGFTMGGMTVSVVLFSSFLLGALQL